MSIAVLPFHNMSPTADAESFSDGMTKEIINSLAAVPALHVAARSIRVQGLQRRRPSDRPRARRVDRARGKRAASRISVDDGYQLWSNRWDRDLADVLAVQHEIAQALASTLKLRVVESYRTSATGRTQNPEAYDRHLKGTYLCGQAE